MPYKELGSRLKQGIQNKVDKLKDGAPHTLDTFKETAEAITSIKKYQKYINTDLDYGIFKPLAKSSTFIVCESVKDGNLLIDTDGYIILNANKKYNIFVDLYNTVTTTDMWLVDKEGNQVSVGKSTGSLGFLNIETTEEIHVAIKFNLGASLETEWCGIIVQEVGRAIVIDPLEHVNSSLGIEDTPVGHIISHTGKVAPKHYLMCDGAEYNISDYPYLAQHIKDNFGIINAFGGDGEKTFAVPKIDDAFLACIKYEPTYFMTNGHINYFNPNLYSKEEKVIGCWINGKPLYQKTFTTKVPKVSTQIALTFSGLNVENIVQFVSSFANADIINTAPNTSGDNYLSFWYNKVAKLLHISCTEETWVGWDLYITVQYTKQSDAENSFNDGMLNYVEGPSVDITYYSDEDVTNAVNALW